MGARARRAATHGAAEATGMLTDTALAIAGAGEGSEPERCVAAVAAGSEAGAVAAMAGAVELRDVWGVGRSCGGCHEE